MKEFFDRMIEYFKANPIFFYILVAAVALLVILIIVLIAVSIHRSKNRKIENGQLSEDAANVVENTDISEAKQISDTPEYVDTPANAQAPAPETAISEENATAAAYEAKPNDLYEKEESPIVPAAKATSQNNASLNKEPEAKTDTVVSIPIEQPKTRAEQEDKPIPEKETAKVRRAYAEKPENTLRKNKQDEEEKKNAYSGKWLICKNEDDSYYFELRASNGEKLLASINYTSVSGAKNGIKTHKNNIQKNNIVISQNKKGQYFFKLLNGSKQLLCTGETYPTKTGCESAVESVKRFAETAVITVVKDKNDDEE